MSSFLARAAYVPVDRVKEELAALVQWALQYLAENKPPPQRQGPETAPAHHLFYSVAQVSNPRGQQHTVETSHDTLTPGCVPQSIFYVIMFRHKQLLSPENGRSWMRSLDLRRIVTSWLRPMACCSPDICGLFVRIMKDAKVRPVAWRHALDSARGINH